MEKENEMIKVIGKYINKSDEYIRDELLDCDVFGNKMNLTAMMLLELLSIFEEKFGKKLDYDTIKDLNKITLRIIIDLYIER